jgi:hypothetical protein
MEVMNLMEKPWSTDHHQSYFLPSEDSCMIIEVDPTTETNFHSYKDTLNMHDAFSEDNMSNISQSMPVNISRKPGIVENVFIGQDCTNEEIHIYTALFKENCDVVTWSYEEMSGINPWIVEHEIKAYPNVKPVRQKLRVVNPKKALAIK